MKKVTIALLAHVDAGKTTLSEAMLYHTGIIKKMGRVDKKDAYLDFDNQERDRGITIYSKQIVMNYQDTSFTILDTPGHVDFSCEMERTLQVLDYAVIIISAREGIQSHTKTIWKLLQYYQIPVFIFVNKMDLSYQSQDEIIKDIQNQLSQRCLAVDEYFHENISLLDDDLLEQYLNNQFTLSDITKLILDREVFPICFGSALKDDGIISFLDILNLYTCQKESYDETSGIVFKKLLDRNNDYTFLKLTGGSLKVKDIIDDEKIDEMRVYSGKNYQIVQIASAGEIVACKGLKKIPIGFTFGKEKPLRHQLLQPFTTYQIILPHNIDKHKAIDDIMTIAHEDPSLQISYDEQTQELKTKVMGEIQLDTLKYLIEQRYHYEVEFDEGSVTLLETITNKVEGVGHFEPLRHYAEVHIILEPLERGQGIMIENKCEKNTLPVQYQNLVLTHMQEIEHRGVLTGSPITDMKMTLVSGKAHLKHTEGGDFREATYRAIRNGLKKAHSLLLEPFYRFEILVPSGMLSQILYDLDGFHSQYDIIHHEKASINGIMPVRAMFNYQKMFLSKTKGEGELNYHFDGYQECKDSQELIDSIGYHSENDRQYPTGSIFCKHGAGFYVPYDEVENYMHLPYVLQNKTKMNETVRFQVDEKELEEIFVRTYGPIKRRLSKDMYQKSQQSSSQEKVTILPECLLVDGYNIIFSWHELSELAKTNLDLARERLIDILCNYQGYRQCLLILVFDAYKVKHNQGSINKHNNIYIVYTKEAQTADNYIEKVTHDLTQQYRVYVATSDALEQVIVSSKGAMRISARELEILVKATHEKEFNEFARKNKHMKNYLLEDIKKEH